MSANSNSSRPSNACVLGRTNSRKKSMAIRQVTPNHQISIGHVTTMRLKPATLSGAGLPKQSHINTDRLLRESAMRGELMQQTPANHYTAFVKKAHAARAVAYELGLPNQLKLVFTVDHFASLSHRARETERLAYARWSAPDKKSFSSAN